MDDSANQPPAEEQQQPDYDYPPMAQQEEEDPYHNHHHRAATTAPQQQAPHHPHQQIIYHAPPYQQHSVPGPGGGGVGGDAMSALTAAAVAAQPATPTSESPRIMSNVPNSMPAAVGHPGAIQQHRPQPTNSMPFSAAPISQSLGGHPQQSNLGKVVESGHEHTGRWTKEEHESFLSALQLYGKEWKKVAARVKTRTVVQTRTHAQKYFQKLQKVLEVSLFS